MENVVIIAVLIIVIAIGAASCVKHFKGQGGCCGGGGTVRTKKKLEHIAGEKTVIIEGMMCENCEARVERFINDLPGMSARVSHKKKRAVVAYEKAFDESGVRAAVEKAGYRVVEIQ